MEAYQWLKVLHILAFTSWMAMLFYIPRLFVYHAEHIQNSGFNEVVKIQENKLYYFIGWPAMLATLISGSGLIVVMGGGEYLKSSAWIHIKFVLILMLIAYHFLCGFFMKQFAQGKCKLSGKFFRVFNEIPTLVLIGIVYLVVFQPAFWVK
ncbi:protoporphyrinogen oxidase HemJ [Helicobacter kayseriensis]|uniref:protoporphyrinogen oxidase HemJ n=1 Tax=Helicobacter kayseriensis TaxID=2905877 RepID=UPI001E3FAF7C|nr:protoporphyrinogen oxidase HemJ [Helicobacter kayseriensis]MCE3046620.1 protoporphyrinogen oxidase HemJ [Helicobacter kayseriensis]MCE3048078.1 protoporphyrinogen oxidase HemJ [Helicobacter kayseriensis]